MKSMIRWAAVLALGGTFGGFAEQESTGSEDPNAIYITNGILQVTEASPSETLGPVDNHVYISDNGTLDISYPAALNVGLDKITHDVILHLKGEGYNGMGTLYNSGSAPWQFRNFGRIVLEGDTLVGGGQRLDLEKGTSSYGYTGTATLTDNGAGYTLTITNDVNKNYSFGGPEFGIMGGSSVSVGKIKLVSGGVMGIESSTTLNVPAGVEQGDNTQVIIYDNYPAGTAPWRVTDGRAFLVMGRKNILVTNPLTVEEGATLELKKNAESRYAAYHQEFNAAVTNHGTLKVMHPDYSFNQTLVNNGTIEVRGTNTNFRGRFENNGTLGFFNSLTTFENCTITNNGTINATESQKQLFSDVTFEKLGTFNIVKGLTQWYKAITFKESSPVLTAQGGRGIDFHASQVKTGDGNFTIRQQGADNAIWLGGGYDTLTVPGTFNLELSGGQLDVRAYAKDFPTAKALNLTMPGGTLDFTTRGTYASDRTKSRTAYLDGTLWSIPSTITELQFYNMTDSSTYQYVKTVVTNADWTIPQLERGVHIGYGNEADITFRESSLDLPFFFLQSAAGYTNALTLCETDVDFKSTGNAYNPGFFVGVPQNHDPKITLNGVQITANADWGLWYERRDTGRKGMHLPYWGAEITFDGAANTTNTFDLNGHTVTYSAGLKGLGNLELKGNGDFRTSRQVQGVLRGGVAASGTGVKDVSGASTVTGLVTVADGSALNVGVSGTNSVMMALIDCRNWTAQKRGAGSYSNLVEAMAFNGAFPYRATALDTTELKPKTNDVESVIGDGMALIYKGQFYAPTSGTYTFAGAFDNGIEFAVDGTRVFQAVGWDEAQSGTRDLEEGWHDFRLALINQGGDAYGPGWQNWSKLVRAIGWTNGVVSAENVTNANAYIRFNTDTLAMRAADPAMLPTVNAQGNTCLWKHRAIGGLLPSDWLTTQNFDFSVTTNSFAGFNLYNKWPEGQKQALNEVSGYFECPAQMAGVWTLLSCYDDKVVLSIDDAVVATAIYNPVSTNSFYVSSGWHKFSFRCYDTSGGYGAGWRNANATFRVKLPGTSKYVTFDDTLVQIRATRDEIVGGELPTGLLGGLTLGTGAAVTNTATVGGCPVYGTVQGAGSLAGQWLLMPEAKLVYRNVAKAARSVAGFGPWFTDAQTALFRHGGKVEVDFAEAPTGSKIVLAPAGGLEGLSAEALATRVTATVQGEAVRYLVPRVEGGNLVLGNLHGQGTVLYIR